MRVSACASIVVALLATDVAAWTPVSYGSWRWSSNTGTQAQAQGQNGRPKNIKTIYRTVYAPAVTKAPVAAPTTTLIRVTTTPAAAPVAAPEAPVAEAPAAEAPAAEAPSTGSSSLSSDAQKALDAHNAARSEVNNAALSWDAGLEADALAWAQNLANIGSLTHSSGSGQGENLYMSSGRSGDHLTSASDLWIAEKADYSGQKVGDGNFASYGHYTQAVWKSTTKVGIASASGPSGTYVVARYSPPGNMIGQTPF
ncbi:CAP domain-containing protein [Plectosphaerella plurivora]|uniref:CAP domain-containing protein n=1 Tax=Plectosphaerella plurivora TaxID=936078 RepID=A0A9P8VL56_9PEZI|nr:CAP domain-containing protein [Plectosphaerella plurivora]